MNLVHKKSQKTTKKTSPFLSQPTNQPSKPPFLKAATADALAKVKAAQEVKQVGIPKPLGRISNEPSTVWRLKETCILYLPGAAYTCFFLGGNLKTWFFSYFGKKPGFFKKTWFF